MVRERTVKVKKSRPGIVDPKAGDRLAAAAAAAGCDSIEHLANLVADSGAIACPPDGITERYSLEDLGEVMWAQMPGSDRPGWFASLVETQRIALITMLRTRQYSTAVIARDFGISEVEVNKIYSRYADDLGGQVVNVRLNTLVGNLQLLSERATELAAENGDAGTMWRIGREMVKMLQDLGIVKKAIHRSEVVHKFEDQRKAEVDALLELERKQAARREELKKADLVSVDAVPRLQLPQVAGRMAGKFRDSEDDE